MLLRYGAKNFFCFKEWMVIDLRFESKNAKEINKGKDYARSMCLKGANSSGKTNALKALAFISHFCKNSFSQKPDSDLQFNSFFNNTGNSEFFIEFRIADIIYLYEAEMNTKTVISESIYKTDQRKTLVLSRKNNKIEKNSLFDQKQQLIIRDNASIISTAIQYGIKEFDPIYNFFNNILINVGYDGLRQDFVDVSALSKFYNLDLKMLDFTKEKIKQFDIGINDIEIKSFLNDKKEEIFFPVFNHISENTIKKLAYESQSSGTKSLFVYLTFYYRTLLTGGTLALDEFDINLHPDILPHLVSWFEDEKINVNNAQLIFTTHNTEIMDKMGKYRTYLFNKEEGNSYCYRLDELSEHALRNDRPISPLYKAGKIGGVPVI